MFGQTKLAISVEGASARALVCNGRSVLRWFDVPLESRCLRNGFLVDVRGFAEAVGAAEKAGGLPRGHVVAAVPGLQHFSRVLRVPKNARKNLGLIVSGEVRRSIPDAERNMQIAWDCLGPKDALQLAVFVLAVPRQPVVTLIESLAALKLRPKAIDIRPLALARACNQQDAIIGNCENSTLDVVIVRNDIPVAMRSLYLGEDYDQELVNVRLAEEITRTITHYNSSSQDGLLPADTAVFLSGRGARDPAVVEEMVQRPVAEAQPPFDYPAEFPAREYMVLLGLILK